MPSLLNSRAVLVIATLMPAAKHRVAMLGESVGNTKQSARPKAAPAVKTTKKAEAAPKTDEEILNEFGIKPKAVASPFES